MHIFSKDGKDRKAIATKEEEEQRTRNDDGVCRMGGECDREE